MRLDNGNSHYNSNRADTLLTTVKTLMYKMTAISGKNVELSASYERDTLIPV